MIGFTKGKAIEEREREREYGKIGEDRESEKKSYHMSQGKGPWGWSVSDRGQQVEGGGEKASLDLIRGEREKTRLKKTTT